MATPAAQPATVERWGVFELALVGPSGGNPYVDVTLSARFSQGERVCEPEGFYDGDGVYRVRFMPDALGEWRYTTRSNAPALDGHSGRLVCGAPSPGNHGPVGVRAVFHFAYADGTPYFPFGTTCYAWTHQGDALEEQTLASLRQAAFNKLRMCVFPKSYIYNTNEPVHYPFARDAGGGHDFTRFNPRFFQHLERRVQQLGELGIEADLILFHPYDRWGYMDMGAENDERYLRYVVARLAAYRNVWWSLANEYDFLLDVKPAAQWDRFFQLLQTHDPYGRLRSIHNGNMDHAYDHTRPWVSHVCVQHWDTRRVREWRARYQKPVIDDECEYEGDIPRVWGNISARELVHRCWTLVVNGGYAGHGETYLHPDDILWWSKGGVLRGESWSRLAFLRRLLEETVTVGLTPLEDSRAWRKIAAGGEGDVHLIYFGEHQPALWPIGVAGDAARYAVDVIDPWAMTVTSVPLDGPPVSPPTRGVAADPPAAFGVRLPGRPYLALRVRRIPEPAASLG